MKKMIENPDKYPSHVLNISYNGISTPNTADVKAVIDDLVASGATVFMWRISRGGQVYEQLT